MRLPSGVARSGGLAGYHRAERYRSARERMEWSLARIFLLFRLLHVFQMAGTAVDMLHRLDPVAGTAILAIGGAETVWLFARIVRRREYGGSLTAGVDLGTGVLMLVIAGIGAPATDRPEALAPLVFWTTDQISGAALSRNMRILVAGTAAVTVLYLGVVLLGDPAEALESTTIIAASGFVVLAVVVERGTAYLRRTAADLADLSRRAAEERAYLQLASELHTHWGNTLFKIAAHDCARSGEFDELRESARADYARLRAFFDTGLATDRTSLLRILHREILDARDRRLIAEPVISESFREYAATVPERLQSVFADALRAVLLNVTDHARTDHTYVRADIRGGRAAVAVTDHGPGFPDRPVLGSLSAIRSRLRSFGGDLTWPSTPGDTRVIIEFPLAAVVAEGAG
ncbi:hypothetical protein [Planotetraspora kaengkrachanensis]|uniref:ATP-binding protein n=1 Tax=Planotetraspora kaengkrachanensis TaxID=575193 RepID=A0A8J3PSG4_9ACTN|nr:hypothetical protein [Planotetraspora kaengkrachanensis]GIG78191.1 hypothetical protein Pka01_13180 [Planotetraspora kaengkrachanensis]